MQEQWVEVLVRYQYLEPLVAGRRVLELGCGSGRAAALLAQSAERVLAIETSPATIEQAREEHGELDGLEFAVGQPDRIPRADGCFDVVLVPELQRWITRGGLIPEIQRLLADNGVVVFSVPSADAGASNGLGYGDFIEYLGQGFEHVRLVGEIAFEGTIMADFEPDDEELDPLLDCSLVEEDDPPRAYLALCGNEPLAPAAYAVLQVPSEWTEGRELGRLRAELDRARQQARQAEARAEDWAGRAEQVTERAMAQNALVEELTVRVQQLQAELEHAERHAGAEAQRELEAQREELMSQVEELRAFRGDRAVDPDVEELQRQLADAERRVLEASTQARAELTTLRSQLREQEKAAAEAREELAAAHAALEEARGQLSRPSGVDEARVELQRTVDASRRRIGELEARLARAGDGEGLDLLKRSNETLATQLEQQRQRADEERRRADRALEEQRQRAEAAERRCDGLVTRIEQGGAELSKLHQRIAELQGLRQADRWRVDELTGRLRDAEAKLAVAAGAGTGDEALVAARQRIAELEAQLAGGAGRAAAPDERIAELERELLRAESRVTEHERRATAAEGQIAQLEVKLKRSTAEAATLSKWAGELRDELKDANGPGQPGPDEPEVQALESQALRNDLARASGRISELEARCDQLMAEVNRGVRALEEKEQQLEVARQSADPAIAEELALLRAHAEELAQAREDATAAADRVERLEQALRDSEQAAAELAQTREELSRLRADVRDVDGASEELEQLRLQAARFAQSEQELNELRQQLSRLREKDGGNGESAADSSELLLVRQRQLDVLLEGAALHERETAQLQQRLGEMEELAEELHHERDELELQLSDCRRQAERDGERHELLRREVTDLGRQLAVAQGQLKRLGEGEAATPPASAGESETSAELARERGERRRLQGELEARLDQLDALRREVDARQRELDDLRSEDTERRAEVLELRRQVRQLERAAAARPSGDADGRPFDWAQDAEPELRRRCQELEREVQRQRRLRGDCQAELERFTREVDFLREQLAERQAELKAQRAQLEKRP